MMLYKIVALILTLIFLFTLLYILLNFESIKTRILKKNDPKILKSFFNLSHAAGYDYEDEKIKQLLTYYLFVCSIFGYLMLPFGILIGSAAGLLGLYLFLIFKSKSTYISSKQINDELCYSVARRLRSGESLIDALKNIQAQYSNSLIVSNLNNYVENGYSIENAIAKATSNENIVKTESEKMLCGTIVLAHKMGGNSARIFERIGDCFHHTYELSSDTKSALAQVKLSAMVISALPVGFLAISSLIGLGGTSFLFTEPIGIVCLVGGLTLQAIGIYWMRRMVQKGVGIWTS